MLNDMLSSCLVTNNIVLIKFLCHFIRFSLIQINFFPLLTPTVLTLSHHHRAPHLRLAARVHMWVDTFLCIYTALVCVTGGCRSRQLQNSSCK